ncbi:MAG: polysaccharide biosynthesis/export family protein [Sphingobacteriia bacterium]|nr:polysaccharide biosynthesis/export family protein [Sphingobacteriia bacterium]
MKKITYLLVLPVILFYSCSTQKRIDKNFTYFQKGLDSLSKLELKNPLIEPNDLLSIQVYSNSLNQEQVALYNMVNGITSGVAAVSPTSGYLVTDDGNIFFPGLGKLYVKGLTSIQLKDSLENKLRRLSVKDPSVVVRFLNFKISVLGEVQSPGVKNLNTQRVTLLDAIALSGDLTAYGRRDSILVIRDENGELKHYNVDLRNTSFINSPVFQLKQNDVVYVRPNDAKLKIVKRNPNVDRDISLTLSVLSLVTVLVSLTTFIKSL